MAAPTIAEIMDQQVLINTNYSLDVSIRNNPTTVTVSGLYEGFSYSYSNGRCTISGRSREFHSGAWTIVAENSDGSATSTINYVIAATATTIEALSFNTIFKNRELKVALHNIRNVHGIPSFEVSGLLLGLTYSYLTLIGSRRTRLFIEGTVSDNNLTVSSGSWTITANYPGGTTSFDQNFTLYDENEGDILDNLFVLDNSTNRVYVVDPSTGSANTAANIVKRFNLPVGGGYRGMAIDRDANLYFTLKPGSFTEILRFSAFGINNNATIRTNHRNYLRNRIVYSGTTQNFYQSVDVSWYNNVLRVSIDPDERLYIYNLANLPSSYNNHLGYHAFGDRILTVTEDADNINLMVGINIYSIPSDTEVSNSPSTPPTYTLNTSSPFFVRSHTNSNVRGSANDGNGNVYILNNGNPLTVTKYSPDAEGEPFATRSEIRMPSAINNPFGLAMYKW